MVFPVVMYGCESWTIKKSEHRRIDAFELWCWRRLLRAPWTARKSNQSILKEISPGCSLEGLMLKLKLQYFGHLMRRADSLEKTLMLGRIEGRKRRRQQKMRWLDGITYSMDMGLGGLQEWWWTGRPGMLWFMGSQRVGHDWATELNWTEWLRRRTKQPLERLCEETLFKCLETKEVHDRYQWSTMNLLVSNLRMFYFWGSIKRVWCLRNMHHGILLSH